MRRCLEYPMTRSTVPTEGDALKRRPSRRAPKPMTLVWITAIRGATAIVLALALLLLQGDRAPSALVNFMGVYWMVNGLVTFQWGRIAVGPRRKVPLAAGAVGTVTGAAVLVANVGTEFLLATLGIMIALTGMAHLLGGFEIADVSGRRWRPGIPLGILELGLGATLLLTSGQTGAVATWLVIAWATLGGIVLLSDAFLMRRRILRSPASSHGGT